MAKKIKSVFEVLMESVGLYFSQIDKFIKYMTFPVLGQIVGLGIIFITTYYYTQNMPKLIDKYPNLNELWIIVSLSVLITLPGLIIFCKAFWDYLVAYGAINSMFVNLQKSGKLYDFDAHNELIRRRCFSYVGLWMIFGIFSAIAICPLFWVICAVFAIYFILSFQVFTFEPELSPAGCLKKSLLLIRGHFAQTFSLLIIIAGLTYIIIPQIFMTAFEYTGIITALSNGLMPFIENIPELNFEPYGMGIITHSHYAAIIVSTVVAQILIQYTLPLRSLLWSNWYKELNSGIAEPEIPSNSKNKQKKRPSEKLMAASKKKFSKKKLDDNILRRAMEQDDE